VGKVIWLKVAIFSIILAAQTAQAGESLSGKDRYIAGGIVGSVLGLGVGHAIEGRYKGLLFTITEAAAITLIIVGSVVPMPQGAKIPIILVGALGLAGFKIWEIIDIWTGPNYANAALLPEEMQRNGYAVSMAQNLSAMSSSVLQGGLTFRF
jgi:hypothetical protein